MRGLIRVVWLLVLVAGAAMAAAAERNPVAHPPRAQARAGSVERLVVRLRASPAAAGASVHARLASVAMRSELSLESSRAISGDIHALRVRLAPGASLADTLARLRQDPQVLYAELDHRRYPHAVPDDPLYPQQWFLMPSSAVTPSAIDAQTAWSTTTGSPSLVIADIDTGVRFQHPDLLAAASGGRLLAGYCFISDAFVAGNSTCPGPDASDPGDWVTQADLAQSECGGNQVGVSSWHGTRVAGILGALSNNAIGIAGVTWSAQLLPLRGLGRCGGFDSDIIQAMLWAAGIPVAGVANNTKPARIINMSLGSAGSCGADFQDAINQVTAKGVLVVASAGNEGGPVDAPANCPGVVGVAGLRHAGTKVGYSSLGPEVALGAPAGNCVNTDPSQPCLYTLTTTTNLGSQGPDVDDYTGAYYCDPSSGSTPNCQITGLQYRTSNLGTSFAAPMVAGIAALMVTSNPKLNACQLGARLREGALPYPQTSVGASPQPPMCHVPASASDVQGSECICTSDGQTCGAGMASASGALKAALRPIAAVVLPLSAASGQTIQLKAAGSAAIAGHSITQYAWTQRGGAPLTLQNAATATASLVMPSCGVSAVRLTVTDDAGREDSADVDVTMNSVTSDAPANAGDTGCSFTPPAVEVGVCPSTASVQAGGSQSLSASIINTSNTAVTWEVEGIPGGDATVGTVTSAGVYTAPASPPAGGTVTVSAVSVADASVSASSALTVTAASGSGGGGGGALEWATLGAALACLGLRRRCARRAGAGRR